MNRWRNAAVLCAALAAWAVAPAARAAEYGAEALLACANEPDDARRLRCFDDAVAGLRRAVPSSAAAESPPPSVARPSSTTAPTAEDRFGARGELKPDERLDAITATVTALDAKPYGERVITLDNGQVWEEIAPGSKLRLKTGDSVRIEAGALGSFRLVAPSGRSSKVSRIR